MFIEPQHSGSRTGWIEVICGSMFSGKTEEIIRRLRRAEIARRQVRIFKPALDTRYHKDDIVSHNKENSMQSTPLAQASDILPAAAAAEVIGIDEAQFFDNALPEVAGALARRGMRVIVAGLDMDSSGAPFGPMPSLLAQAEFITKLHAICACCGGLASYTYRRTEDGPQILLGAQDLYEARCRACFFNRD